MPAPLILGALAATIAVAAAAHRPPAAPPPGEARPAIDGDGQPVTVGHDGLGVLVEPSTSNDLPTSTPLAKPKPCLDCGGKVTAPSSSAAPSTEIVATVPPPPPPLPTSTAAEPTPLATLAAATTASAPTPRGAVVPVPAAPVAPSYTAALAKAPRTYAARLLTTTGGAFDSLW